MADHKYFFGREDQVFALYRLIDRSRFAAVVGTSGSGKSSLVRAGLLPLLHEETKDGGARKWVCFELRPGNTPLARLADELAGRQPDTGDEPDLAFHKIRRETVEVLLRRSSFGLREALREINEVERHSILIVVDQFEEILRYADLADGEDDQPLLCESRFSEAAAFVQLLLEASRDPERPIHVMLTMRSDYLGDCALFHDLPEAVAASPFLVPSLTRDQREQAIRGPIEQAGATIEPELVQRLLNDGGAGNDQLPVLQHALMRTWDVAGRPNPVTADAAVAPRTPPHGGAGSRHLMSEHYEAIGTLANALSQHAEEIMSELGGLEQAVEQTFRALAELDRDNRAIRRPRSFDRLLAESGVPGADLRRVLDRFRRDDCSFLVPPHPEPIDGGTIVDIGHEALIRRWDRMGASPATTSGEKGWLWAEADDGNFYRGLLALAGDDSANGSAALPLDQVESRWRWWDSRPRTDAWAARYGGGRDRVQHLFENSQRALEADRRRLEKEEADRQRRMRVAVVTAVVLGILTAAATGGFVYALQQKEKANVAAEVARAEARRADDAAEQARAEAERAEQAVTETKAASFWSRLQLWGDPLRQEDVVSLWDLTQADDNVRVAFVRQLSVDHGLVQRFGFKPQPIARAIGLRWPDEAREIAKQSLDHVASNDFDPTKAGPFALVAYTGALAALQPWLDAATFDAGAENIARAINRLAGSGQLSDQQLWVLAEAVGVFGARIDPVAIEPARSKLREIIVKEAPNANAGRRGQAISRAIELMAPDLTAEERLKAVRTLAPLLGRNTDSWSAKATPRAMVALLPRLDVGQAAEMLNAMPPAIAASGVAAGNSDSSYLLALVQVVETLSDLDDEQLIVEFSQVLTAQLAQPNDPLQRAALARAAVPLLEGQGGRPADLVAAVAGIALVPEQTGVDLDPAHRSRLRRAAVEDAEDALRQALAAPDGAQEEGQSDAALRLLHTDLSTEPTPHARSNPYRRAAQARLLEMLAPSLTQPSAARASADLLAMLPDTDYLTRAAIARALAALAPKLPDSRRTEAHAAAKIALAKTGSSEEATAWAGAIAALLPVEPRRAATAEIVEALKYPTATGAPSDVLLAALAKLWPEEYKTIAGRTLPDQIVWDWLEAHLPEGGSLSEPPPLPPDLHAADAGLGG